MSLQRVRGQQGRMLAHRPIPATAAGCLTTCTGGQAGLSCALLPPGAAHVQ